MLSLLEAQGPGPRAQGPGPSQDRGPLASCQLPVALLFLINGCPISLFGCCFAWRPVSSRLITGFTFRSKVKHNGTRSPLGPAGLKGHVGPRRELAQLQLEL